METYLGTTAVQSSSSSLAISSQFLTNNYVPEVKNAVGDENSKDFCRVCAGQWEAYLTPVYEDDILIVVNTNKPQGATHWLILPKLHIRDIEETMAAPQHLPLLRHMDEIRTQLLDQQFPQISPARLACGFHRGRRTVLGGWLTIPDNITVRHLHCHIVVDPYWKFWLVKYSEWMPWRFIGLDTAVKRMEEHGVGEKKEL